MRRAWLAKGVVIGVLLLVPLMARASASEPTARVALGKIEAEAYEHPYAYVQLAIAPREQKINVQARLRVIPTKPQGSGKLTVLIPSRAKLLSLTLNDRKATFARDSEQVAIDIPDALQKIPRFVLALTYDLSIPAHSVPDSTIRLTEQGFNLPPTAHWLPKLTNPGQPGVSLHVRAPQSWRVLGSTTWREADGKGMTHFEFSETQSLGLCAGPWRHHVLSSADVLSVANTLEWIPNAEQILKQLQTQSGPIPIPAQRIILVQLPDGFGNWQSEQLSVAAGSNATLAAYLAYRCFGAKSQPSRIPWLTHSLMAYLATQQTHALKTTVNVPHLESYLEFLKNAPRSEQPLSGPNPESAWEATIMNKGVLIWDVLRRETSDAAFWNLLERLFKRATEPRPLETFLQESSFNTVRAYLEKTGLPQPRLEGVTVNQTETGYHTQGSVMQRAPFFKVPVELMLITEQGVERTRFNSVAERTPVSFTTTSRPLRLILDPNERILMARRAQLRVSDALRNTQTVIVYGTMGTPTENLAMRAAAESLRLKLKSGSSDEIGLCSDQALSPDERRRTLWLVGRPDANAIASDWVNQFPVRYLDQHTLWWQGRSWRSPATGVIQMIANPNAPSESVILIGGSNSETFKHALRHLNRPSTFCIFNAHGILTEGLLMSTFPDPNTDVPLY